MEAARLQVEPINWPLPATRPQFAASQEEETRTLGLSDRPRARARWIEQRRLCSASSSRHLLSGRSCAQPVGSLSFANARPGRARHTVAYVQTAWGLTTLANRGQSDAHSDFLQEVLQPLQDRTALCLKRSNPSRPRGRLRKSEGPINHQRVHSLAGPPLGLIGRTKVYLLAEPARDHRPG
ncbi:Hypothetical predicted protein [Olea europaea subsp. europaea]|uniref:Uncharacterized protein n=1 Tax=Olea europaea subsp. europaea TaxID=158383 RepID=A0A8S0TM33_OLEEU|nr:Hypothetical predicted protein [Olea europaea subsp. europaea]